MVGTVCAGTIEQHCLCSLLYAHIYLHMNTLEHTHIRTFRSGHIYCFNLEIKQRVCWLESDDMTHSCFGYVPGYVSDDMIMPRLKFTWLFKKR